ncbi:SRPBCC family protein [Nocardia sp. NPDC003693]
MRTIVISREVPGTPEALFATITTPATWEHWVATHREFLTTPPERLDEGSRFTAEILLYGMVEEIEWVVARLDEARKVRLYGTARSGVHCDLTYWLTGTEHGTEVTASVVLTGTTLTGEDAPLVEKHSHTQLDCTLGQLGAMAGALAS